MSDDLKNWANGNLEEIENPPKMPLGMPSIKKMKDSLIADGAEFKIKNIRDGMTPGVKYEWGEGLTTKQDAFLTAYVFNYGNIKKACEIVDVSYYAFRKWKKDSKFGEVFSIALECARECLVDEVEATMFDSIIRGVNNKDKDYRYRSPTLQMFCLNNCKPSIYKRPANYLFTDATKEDAKVKDSIRETLDKVAPDKPE